MGLYFNVGNFQTIKNSLLKKTKISKHLNVFFRYKCLSQVSMILTFSSLVDTVVLTIGIAVTNSRLYVPGNKFCSRRFELTNGVSRTSVMGARV